MIGSLKVAVEPGARELGFQSRPLPSEATVGLDAPSDYGQLNELGQGAVGALVGERLPQRQAPQGPIQEPLPISYDDAAPASFSDKPWVPFPVSYRKQQSVWVHLGLLFTTAGIGNFFYARYVRNWNWERGR